MLDTEGLRGAQDRLDVVVVPRTLHHKDETRRASAKDGLGSPQPHGCGPFALLEIVVSHGMRRLSDQAAGCFDSRYSTTVPTSSIPDSTITPRMPM